MSDTEQVRRESTHPGDTPSGVIGAILRVYKCSASLVLRACGVRCRHVPTCSEYAALAWQRFGAWPALWMAAARLWRCRPGGSIGPDPVPHTLPANATLKPWRYGLWRL